MLAKKKLVNLSSLFFKLKDTTNLYSYFTSTSYLSSITNSSSWPWPSCRQPKTHSFRDVNSEVYFDSSTAGSLYYLSTNSSEEQERFSSTLLEDSSEELLETYVVHGLRSDRLFLDSNDMSSSIVFEKANGKSSDVHESAPFEDTSVVMTVESEDPYSDFRLSMEEMVIANGIEDYEGLEELVLWYLRVNEKKTHTFIVGAFLDLLLGLTLNYNHDLISPYCSSSISFEDEDQGQY